MTTDKDLTNYLNEKRAELSSKYGDTFRISEKHDLMFHDVTIINDKAGKWHSMAWMGVLTDTMFQAMKNSFDEQIEKLLWK